MGRFKCKGCKNRTVEPNCHSTCESYLKTKEQMNKAVKALFEDNKVDNTIESLRMNRKKIHIRKKGI